MTPSYSSSTHLQFQSSSIISGLHHKSILSTITNIHFGEDDPAWLQATVYFDIIWFEAYRITRVFREYQT